MFSANSQDFAVYCASSASFANVAFAATAANITGIATVYKDNAQLTPRNLSDVSGFTSTAPLITELSSTSLSFGATGGKQSITVTCSNQGSNTLSASGLSGILSAEINGNEITVTAEDNTTGNAENQTLTISLENGNSVEVPVYVAGKTPEGSFSIGITNANISGMTSSGYAAFNYSTPDGLVWTGRCGITSSNAQYGPFLQLKFNNFATAVAFNSRIVTPKIDGIIQSITIETTTQTVGGRKIMLLPTDYSYAAGTTAADVEKDAYKTSSPSVDTGYTFVIDNIESENLSELSIFASGGAVYVKSITINCISK